MPDPVPMGKDAPLVGKEEVCLGERGAGARVGRVRGWVRSRDGKDRLTHMVRTTGTGARRAGMNVHG